TASYDCNSSNDNLNASIALHRVTLLVLTLAGTAVPITLDEPAHGHDTAVYHVKLENSDPDVDALSINFSLSNDVGAVVQTGKGFVGTAKNFKLNSSPVSPVAGCTQTGCVGITVDASSTLEFDVEG